MLFCDGLPNLRDRLLRRKGFRESRRGPESPLVLFLSVTAVVVFAMIIVHLHLTLTAILIAAFDFGGDDEALRSVDLDGKGGAGMLANRGAALFDRLFDVLRRVISSANNDQVFHASGDKEFALMKTAEIAGA